MSPSKWSNMLQYFKYNKDVTVQMELHNFMANTVLD